MAISFITNALGSSSSTTSFSITLPTTVAGDILILEFTHRGLGDGTIAGTSVSSGGLTWNLVHDQEYATNTFSGYTYWTRATGNHSGQTVTGASLTNSCAAILTQYRGAISSGTPLAGFTGEDNASGNETQVQITTVDDDAWVVLVVANSPDLAVTTPSATSPTTLSNRAERLSTGGTDTSIIHASAEKPLAGATGAFTWAQVDAVSGSWAYYIIPQTPTYSLTAAGFYEDGSEAGATLIDDSQTAAATYYFNASDGGPTDPGTVWTSDANAFDGSTATAASASANGSTSSNYLQGDGTDAPTSGGGITQVRARLYSTNALGGNNTAAIYSDSLGELLGSPTGLGSGTDPAWGSYVTLTTPSGGWTWQKVSDLEVKIFRTTSGAAVARVEVEVTSVPDLAITRDVSGGDSPLHIRVRLQETAGVSGASTDDYRLQVSLNGGAYANVTASSAQIQAIASASLTNGATTTNRLGAGSGSFVVGEVDNGDGEIASRAITASNYSELLFSVFVRAVGVVDGDTLDFRVLRNAATTGMTYTLVPRITVEETAGGDPSVNKSESIAVAESVQRLLESYVNKSETATVAESVSLTLVNNVNVNNSTSITESTKLETESRVNVSDTATITESTVVLIPELLRAVSDSASVAESTKVELNSFVSKSDSVGVAESVNLTLTQDINVSDSASVAESTKVELNSFVSKSESVGVAEAVNVLIPDLYASVSDSASVAESLKLEGVSFVNKSESASVAESVKLEGESRVSVSDSAGVAESTKLEVESYINKTEAIGVAESASVSIEVIGERNVSVSDSIAVAEAVQLMAENRVNVNDAVAVAEALQRLLESRVAVSDAASVAEAVQLLLEGRVSVSDSASIAESLKLELNSYINKSETATITEAVALLIPFLLVSVSDSIAVAEAVSVALVEAGGLAVTASESATVAESTQLLIPELHLTVSDTASVAESVSVSIVAAGDQSVSVSDNLTVTEAVSVLIPQLNLSVQDSAGVAENVAVAIAAGGATGNIKVRIGASFVAKPVKVYTGGSWQTKPVKYFDGADWTTTPY